MDKILRCIQLQKFHEQHVFTVSLGEHIEQEGVN